ncbi:MAG TPA: pilus assembly protein N-terminal domain-containing protein [Verrucomicrobiae bacterium]|nr:pilus assembly protein N-terminal domain-containing protein [Verrucomicrobiae bacterium]
MSYVRPFAIVSAALALSLAFAVVPAAVADGPAEPKPAEPAKPAAPAKPTVQTPDAQQPAATPKPENLLVTVGKSLIIDSPLNIERLAIANDALVNAVAINPKEVLVNGVAPGETSLIVWQKGGSRLVFELTVRPSQARLEAVRQQIAREFPDADINVTYDNEAAFIRGTVKDVVSADRVQAIAATLGKVINLLRVEVPKEDPQFILKVRFADVDRNASMQLGMNLASSAFNMNAGLGTSAPPLSLSSAAAYTLSDAVNVFFFRPDINLAAAITALEQKNLAQTLAEPNVLAINGKQASFLAGGEFPYPQIQPGGNGAITIVFKEYGIRLNFIPTMTPRGTIRLQVAPEVSSLDFSHALTIQGLPVPGLSTRRVQTEVELESGQSFAIAGLLDNELTESFSKVPGIGSIPVLGNLFKTRNTTRTNTELLIIITPQLVRPIPADQPLPQLKMKEPFMPKNTEIPLMQPGPDKTGPVPVNPPSPTVPLETITQTQKQGQQAPSTPQPFTIIPLSPGQPNVNTGVTPPPMTGGGGGGQTTTPPGGGGGGGGR